MARFLAMAIVFSCGMAAGCQNSGPDAEEQIYKSSLAQWNDEGPDSYDMVLRRQTISANPDLRVVITVRNNVVTSRIYQGTDIPVSDDAAAAYPDIPGLFAFVRQAMDANPFSLSMSYDPTFGYPSDVNLDVTAGSTSDNVHYTVEELTPVP